MAQHVPELKRPTDNKARHRLHTQGDPVRRQAPEFRARPAQVQTQMALASELVEAAIRHTVPGGVVVFDAWSLAEALGRVWARRRKDWISLLQKNRRLETASFHVRDAHGWPLQRPSPHIAVAALGPLIPAHA